MGIDYKRILIIQLQPVGDVLRATPVVAGLRREYPNAYIGFLVLERYKEILIGNPKLDRIIPLRRRSYQEKEDSLMEVRKEVSDLVKGLQDLEFELVINLHNTLMSALLAYLSRGKRSIGYIINEFGWPSFSNGWKATPSHFFRGMNVVEGYLESTGLSPSGLRLEMYIGEEEGIYRDRFLEEKGVGPGDLLIGLNPGAGSFLRRWPGERFAQLGDELTERFNAKIIIFGSRREEELVKGVSSLMEHKPIELCSSTIRQLAALIERCNLFITNDTGPMHIAAAMGTPIIGIFGPVLKSTALPFASNHIALQADLDCIPCTKSYCEDLKCLQAISVEEVLFHVREMVKADIRGNLAKR